MTLPHSIIFQSAKLGNPDNILEEIDWARQLLTQEITIGRIYGVSGGALVAWTFALSKSAIIAPSSWRKATSALDDLAAFLKHSRSKDIRSFNLNPAFGPFNLKPLRRWISDRMKFYCDQDSCMISDLPVKAYLCAMDKDGTFTLFGPEDESLQFKYHYNHIGPPKDACMVDALIASLSTLLSTNPSAVNDELYRDCRPTFSDAGAIVMDLEASEPRPILRQAPFTPLRSWKLNWITSSFIMHSQNERNQHLLASHYMDLTERHRQLKNELQSITPSQGKTEFPAVYHIDLPYIGSTEADTNMRESVEHKSELMAKFQEILIGQTDQIKFDQPANVVYGAGGFSGILGGLVATRAIDKGFLQGGGKINWVYGVSAGVLNGFFHAVQLAAARYPDLYRASAQQALTDLENFIANVSPDKMVKYNLHPSDFWQGWANLRPLEQFLNNKLAEYTGSKSPDQIRFEDIGLPLTIAAARGDGFTDFIGMPEPERRMTFAGHEIKVNSAPIIKAILAGWSMNTYIQPTPLNGQYYRDGGGTFYDIGIFIACLDAKLITQINIHLDEPEGYSYHLPPKPNLVKILFDTHNYYFPEERRRMRSLTDLLYEHFRARSDYANFSNKIQSTWSLPPDFRQNWVIENL